MSISSKPFYFLRHGQTDWNKKGLIQGQTDIPLNESGIQQARNSALQLKTIEIETIVSSPLSRAVKTAEIVAQSINKSITIVDELMECSWGITEGQKKEEYPPSWLKDWRQSHTSIDNAETYQDFKKRVITGINKAITLPGPILIVAHCGVHSIVQEVTGLEDMDITNCCLAYHQPSKNLTNQWSVKIL